MRNFNPSKFMNNLADSEDDELDSGAEGEFEVVIREPWDFMTPEGSATDDDEEFQPDELQDTSGESDDNEIDTSVSEAEAAKVEDDSNNTRNSVQKRAIDDYDEDEEEDEVVKAIITEIKKPRSKPPDIKIDEDDFVTDLCFHPEQDILAIGTTAGDIFLYKYTNEENTLQHTYEIHAKAVRDIEFSKDGKFLISTGRDRTIMVNDVETQKLARFWDDAHEESVYTMSIIDENLFATGDDDGTLKLWDLRQKEPVFSLKEVEDFISCIITNDAHKYLLMTSGDGYLTTINIPQRKLYVQSEPYEEELSCMGIFRKDSKLVVGSSKGNFYTFNWGQFGYHCDAFSGPQTGINSMIPITERIAVTGGEEGVIRAMHTVPGRILGVVGQHTLAVEVMDICNTGELIASSSHDNDIRFWNIKYFEDFDDIKYNSKPDRKALKHNLPSSNYANTSDFFADLAGAE